MDGDIAVDLDGTDISAWNTKPILQISELTAREPSWRRSLSRLTKRPRTGAKVTDVRVVHNVKWLETAKWHPSIHSYIHLPIHPTIYIIQRYESIKENSNLNYYYYYLESRSFIDLPEESKSVHEDKKRKAVSRVFGSLYLASSGIFYPVRFLWIFSLLCSSKTPWISGILRCNAQHFFSYNYLLNKGFNVLLDDREIRDACFQQNVWKGFWT